MNENDLILVCGRCRETVAPGAGFLGVSHSAMRRYERDMRQWEETHPGDVHDLHDLLAAPEEVAWLVRHFTCAPGADNDSYQIDSERLQTWRDLTRWSAHLMGKTWLPETDWNVLLEEIAEGTSTRILVAVRSAA